MVDWGEGEEEGRGKGRRGKADESRIQPTILLFSNRSTRTSCFTELATYEAIRFHFNSLKKSVTDVTDHMDFLYSRNALNMSECEKIEEFAAENRVRVADVIGLVLT